MNEASRSTSNSVKSRYCDIGGYSYTSLSWNGPGWYKFANPAGTKIPTSPPPKNRCGTHATGWMAEPHPKAVGQTKKVKFCFNYWSNSCSYESFGEVTKCGEEDFVYKLPNTPYCHQRYCAEPGNKTILDLR